MYSQQRVIIEDVTPQLDGGTHFIKAVVGELIPVSASIFSDGHDVLAASVMYKCTTEVDWHEQRLVDSGNDHWIGSFQVDRQGTFEYKIVGWVDYALNWQYGISRKIDDNQHVKSELLEGVEYVMRVRDIAMPEEQDYLNYLIDEFKDEDRYSSALRSAQSDELKAIFTKYPEKFLSNASSTLKVYVDREKARFSTWYEFFPRSASSEDGVHGTFKDCEKLLPRVSNMGFDTLYFPPVHPIGEVNRKGKNNTTQAFEGDVGSPWGIGSKHGGHKSIHPELGTLEDFKSLVQKAKELGVEIAMDFALQAAPDHPWVKEHPEWFKWRPDGTVQYAENPPKKYQDILPIYYESADWKNLWQEMLDTALFWIEECGIKIFRVDNPHTKPFYFWGWMIEQIKAKHPDIIFLAEAFSRPKIMHQLAKQGYTQSYSYFTWRNSKDELIQYMTELTTTDQKYYFRANFWPNTPDINPWALQSGNEATYLFRYFLAATLSSNTGLYGPIYEHLNGAALEGKEEYLDSEKFQLKHWNWELENKLTMVITKINAVRKAHKSLQQTNNIKFLNLENDKLLAYYKYDDFHEDETLMIVNIDPYYAQKGWVQMPLHKLGVPEGHPIGMRDLINGSNYIWDKEWCFVELDPSMPFHLFKINK